MNDLKFTTAGDYMTDGRMNERIADLYEQASSFASEEENPTKSYKDRVMIKFAELIVRECCDILDPGEHQLIARFQARKWLQEHFGVTQPNTWPYPYPNDCP
jgi:hypothetical protein